MPHGRWCFLFLAPIDAREDTTTGNVVPPKVEAKNHGFQQLHQRRSPGGRASCRALHGKVPSKRKACFGRVGWAKILAPLHSEHHKHVPKLRFMCPMDAGAFFFSHPLMLAKIPPLATLCHQRWKPRISAFRWHRG